MDSSVAVEIDYEGLREFLSVGDCVNCEFVEKYDNDERCDGCPIIRASRRNPGEATRVGVSSKIGRLFNVPKPENHGKHNIFFYTYYQQFGCQFPQTPNVDVLGQVNISDILIRKVLTKMAKEKNLKTLQWIIHHINGNPMDDRKENLALMLNTEHSLLHKGNLNERQKAELIQCVIERNKSMFGVAVWGNEE